MSKHCYILQQKSSEVFSNKKEEISIRSHFHFIVLTYILFYVFKVVFCCIEVQLIFCLVDL